MKITMIGCEQGLYESLLGTKGVTISHIHPTKFIDVADEIDGDVLIWRMNEMYWWSLKLHEFIETARKKFNYSVLLNTRGTNTLSHCGDKFVRYLHELKPHFDLAWTYEGTIGEKFCEWMGFGVGCVGNVPSISPSSAFEKYEPWVPQEEKRVAFGIYGAQVIRNFPITAIVGHSLIRNHDVKPVVFSVKDIVKSKTESWIKSGMLLERMPQQQYWDELKKMRFCVYATTGRFTIEAQALGVPVFAGYMEGVQSDDVMPEFRLARRQFELYKMMAYDMLSGDDKREYWGNAVHEYALEMFHPKCRNVTEQIKKLLDPLR